MAILGTPLLLGSAMVSSAGADGEAVFEMREVSPFEATGSQVLVQGQYARCETGPNESVKVYPELKSKQPLYGVVKFSRNHVKPEAGVEYHFVIDESGDVAPAEEPSLLQTPSDAICESGSGLAKPTPMENTYDRMYFDVNRDLDLTNDGVLRPAENPPAVVIPSRQAKQKVVFEDIALTFDFGAEIGSRPFPVLPRLIVSEYQGKDYVTLSFIAKTARQGRIRIGPREYDVVLGQTDEITGRFDHPLTAIVFAPTRNRHERKWWLGALYQMRQVDGAYYTISTTPLGDRLIVKQYDGNFGVLRLGSGGRDIKDFNMWGQLESENTYLVVGRLTNDLAIPESVREWRTPVGDYFTPSLTIKFGGLRIYASYNNHSDGVPSDWERARAYNIKIRKDEPFVLDFSNEPEVMFASPAKDQTFKVDEEIEVKAVLIDPILDIMIRELDDTTRTQEEFVELPDGTKRTVTGRLSLDPMVTITNSSGKVVSAGKMPFG